MRARRNGSIAHLGQDAHCHKQLGALRLLAILAAHERSPASRANRLGRGLDTPTLALPATCRGGGAGVAHRFFAAFQ